MIEYLQNEGLSMSQAQSLSNLCYQRAAEIDRKLDVINNSTKVVMIDNQEYTKQEGYKMPENVLDLLLEKSKYHALQAYLMEMITCKNNLLTTIKNSRPEYKLEMPKPPIFKDFDDYDDYKQVSDQMEFLSDEERVEYLELEAYAAHLGQFIHKDGKLTKLRNSLPKIQELEFILTDGGKEYPVKVSKHHSSDELMFYHEQISKLYRDFEKRLNYLKSKSLTLKNEFNANISAKNSKELKEINRYNKKIRDEYDAQVDDYRKSKNQLDNAHQEFILRESSRVSKLKIVVPTRFKDLVEELEG